MKKNELISALSERTGQPKKEVSETLNALTDVLAGIGSSGDSLTLNGFGTFKGKVRPARTGRNPSNGETIQIAEKKMLVFKPSSALKL